MCSLLLAAALASSPSPSPSTAASTAKVVEVPTLEVASNLILDGIPPIPKSVAERVQAYTEARSAIFQDWHPTKRELLITTRFGETAQVHRVATPGGSREQLTFLKEPVGNSRDPSGATFDPGGAGFIFFQDVGGNEQFQLFHFDLATRKSELLTDGKSRNGAPVWDEKGQRFAYSSTQRNGKDFDLYLHTGKASDAPVRLAEVSGLFGPEAFSRDGRWLLATEYLSANESNLWLFEVGTGQRRRLNPEGEQARYVTARFSADGKSVFAVTNRGQNEFTGVHRLDLATGSWTLLTPQLRWDVDELELSPDGRSLAVLTNEDGYSRLYLTDVKARRLRRLTKVPDGVVYGLTWHSNNRDLGFSFTSHDNPGDAYSVDVKSGQLTRWTFSEAGPVHPEAFSPAESITWKGRDGVELHGLMYRPPKRFGGPRPVLLAHRGGPEAQSRPVYLGASNYYLNELGMAVIYLNIRGSPGYGRTYLALDDGLKREGAYEDVGALLDWVATQPHLDKSKVIFTGGSYGGHLSLVTAYRYPDRILANIDNVGISSFVTFLANTAEYRRELRRAEYGDERLPEVRAWMEKTAPLNNASKIRKPMLVIQGKNDPRVPISEADQIVRTVREQNVPVWYLVATDEGHGFQKKTNAQVQLAVTALFLQKILEGGPGALAPSRPAGPTAP